MFEEFNDRNNNLCRVMRSEISKCELRIKQTEENSTKVASAKTAKNIYTNIHNKSLWVINSLKPLIDDIQGYIDEKREDSKASINNALRLAKEIIPDSMAGIKFMAKDGEAWLETPNGAYVDRTEGSGYKGVTSLFLRSYMLSAYDNRLQFMILDELLSKVSTEHSATLSAVLPVIAENQQIILIEQKKEIYTNINCPTYKFFKDGKYSRVVREEAHEVN